MVSGTVYIFMGFVVVIGREQLTLPVMWLLHGRFDAPTYTGKPGNQASYRRLKIRDFGFQVSASRLTAFHAIGSPACGGG